jgi:hypothetical protein
MEHLTRKTDPLKYRHHSGHVLLHPTLLLFVSDDLILRYDQSLGLHCKYFDHTIRVMQTVTRRPLEAYDKSLHDPLPGQRICEFGAGFGALIPHLASAATHELTIVDLYPLQQIADVHHSLSKFVPRDLRAVFEKGTDQINILLDANKVRYVHCRVPQQTENLRETFDLIIDNYGPHFYADGTWEKQRVVRNYKKLQSPNGRIVIAPLY